jgi:cytochrome d ubiquinol oxidase subunit II
LLVVVTIESWLVRPELFSGMPQKPMAWLGLLGVIGGLSAAITGLQSKRESLAVLGSSSFIAGLMIAGSASVFPILLHSTLAPEYSLSAYQNAAAGHGLAVALVWWPVSLIFSVGYFVFIYRHYTGKVKTLADTQRPY